MAAAFPAGVQLLELELGIYQASQFPLDMFEAVVRQSGTLLLVDIWRREIFPLISPVDRNQSLKPNLRSIEIELFPTIHFFYTLQTFIRTTEFSFNSMKSKLLERKHLVFHLENGDKLTIWDLNNS